MTTTNHLIAQTDTIRQMPQNYCIARKNGISWIMDPDLAADLDLVIQTTAALMIYENKYEQDPVKLLARI